MDCQGVQTLIEYLLTPYLPQDLIAQQIDRPKSHNPIPPSVTIEKD